MENIIKSFIDVCKIFIECLVSICEERKWNSNHATYLNVFVKEKTTI